MIDLLKKHKARVFASVVPRGVRKPPPDSPPGYLRKDLIFLFQRYASMVASAGDTGVIIVDETDVTLDWRLVERIENYFRKTRPGRDRAQWIVPAPIFVRSDRNYPIQVADIVIYCINWGFRTPRMEAPTRGEIAELFAAPIDRLQWRGAIHDSYGSPMDARGIVYVENPYGPAPDSDYAEDDVWGWP